LYEIKWVSRWEANSLDYVKNIIYLPIEDRNSIVKELTAEIVSNGYVFSGEDHLYGRGVPLFYEGKKPIYSYIDLADGWARYMCEIWSSVLGEDLEIWRFRNRVDIPKHIDVVCP
jgi:hypothetical protein